MILVIISILSVIVSWVLLKCLIPILAEKEIVDTPNERTLHQGTVPRGGGVIIVLMLIVALCLIGGISGRSAMFFGLVISVCAWGGLSWWDDQFELSAGRRLIAQSGFAILTVWAFGSVQTVQFASQEFIELSWFGLLVSIVGLVWVANLYNFMDGMDGLAASQTIVASASLSFWFWQFGDQGIAIVCLVLAAASYGFLLWNWCPAKVFMGDVGSVTIGAFFATLTLIAAGRYQMPVLSFVILLGVFVGDASVTLLRRLFQGEPIWRPHRSHYYQRLANIGISHSKIVIGLIILMSISSLIATTTLIYRDTIVIGICLEMVLLTGSAMFVNRLESRNKCTTQP